jgi:hypothetical protein
MLQLRDDRPRRLRGWHDCLRDASVLRFLLGASLHRPCGVRGPTRVLVEVGRHHTQTLRYVPKNTQALRP